jgi:D-alanine-D-alanine ligase
MTMLTTKRIALLKGGPGSERKVSLASGEGVAKALRELGATVLEIDVEGRDFALPDNIDIAFNVIHGTFGEDGQVQQLLDDRGVMYTGEGVEASRLAFDKIETKKKFLGRGVPTARYELIRAGEQPKLPLPIVIKPPREGSSVGVSIVKTAGDLPPALKLAASFGDTLLVEEFIAGTELTVGILGDQALPVIEILPKQGFYDFQNKYPFLNPNAVAAGATHLCPAPIEPAQTRLVQETALAAHRALDLEVYSRVDLILSESGQPFVLELNTIPGMTQASLLPEAAAAAGIGYAALCERIIDLSLRKKKRR